MKLMDLINKLSMEEKGQLACHIAVKISFEDDYIQTRELDDEDYNPVFVLVDFGYSYIHKIMEGRCSLQASLNFDIGKAENKMESDIIHMTDLMDKYNLSIDYGNIFREIEECRKENVNETTEKIQG